MNPWLILAAVLAIAGAVAFGEHRGEAQADARWSAKHNQHLAEDAQARADAIDTARKTEAMWQGVVNETAENYNRKIAGIRRDHMAAVVSLQSRPTRPVGGMPPDAIASRPCATGAELCREDGLFLRGEAARADELRAGLEACYRVIDATRSR